MPNPPLSRIPRHQLPEPIRSAYDRSLELRGDATFFEVFGHHPRLYRWYTESFYGEVFSGGLVDRRTKELVRYRLSTLHGCRFCNQGNRAEAIAAGIEPSVLDDIGRLDDCPDVTAAERAAVALAERMALTSDDASLDDALHARLSAHFSDAEILELGLVIGILSGMARFLFAFDLVEKETTCPFHAETPP